MSDGVGRFVRRVVNVGREWDCGVGDRGKGGVFNFCSSDDLDGRKGVVGSDM